MRTALLLIAWGLSVHLMNSHYAGLRSADQSKVIALEAQNLSLSQERVKLLVQRNAAMQIAKQFQRSQCSI